MAIACKGGLPEWRRNLTHELNSDDKPECNNEYGEEEVDEDGHHYDHEDEDDQRYDHEDDDNDNHSVTTVGDGTLPFLDIQYQMHKSETFKHTNMKLSMRMITTAALPRLEMGTCLALTYINFKRTNMKFPKTQI